MQEVDKLIKKDTFQTLLVRIPVLIFSFLYSIFLIRMLGPEGNGLYSFIMASIGLSMLVVGLDGQKSTLYHIARKEFESGKIMGISLLLYGTGSLITMAIIGLLYLSEMPFSNFFIPEDSLNLFFVFFFLGSFVCQHFTALFSTVIRGQKAFNYYNKYLFGAALFQVLLYGSGYLITLFYSDAISQKDLFGLILIAQFMLLLLSWYYYSKAFKEKVNFHIKSIRPSYVRYARLGYINEIGHFLNKRVDVWFIEMFNGLKNLGFYALASQLTNFLLLAAAPVEEVLKPYLIGMEREEGNGVFTQYFRIVLVIIISLSLILFLCSSWLVPTFFGSDFLTAVLPLKILCLGVVFVNIKRMFINYNRSFNDLNINNWGQWLGVVITIILDIILIPPYGIVGAAWASLAAYAATALFLGGYIIINKGIKLKDLIAIRKDDILFIKSIIGQKF